jgi:flagellar hook-associated protein 1 FlgK
MTLNTALAGASSGLASITQQLATISQNVSNANTPGYVRETTQIQSAVAGGAGIGVRVGVATRTVDAALQREVFGAGGSVAGDQARQDALSAIDAASGTPGSGQDLASLVGGLRDAFSTLAFDPANAAQQNQVVNQASALARGVNTLGGVIQSQRQSVQDSLVADVQAANAALGAIGQLSDQVMAAKARGESTAGLEDQRDVAMASLTQLTGAQFYKQPSGDVLAVSGGTLLPLRQAPGPLAISAATMGPGSTAPPLTVSGAAESVAGGKIGAELDLRDTVLPGLQSNIDQFAQSLATGFAGQGLTLFSTSSGVIPAASAPGFAQTIQVNPAVLATPSMVRDGATPSGAAGDTTLIQTVLTNVLGAGAATISGLATALVASHATLAAAASSRLATDQAVQTGLVAKLSAGTGVSVDSEMADMVKLQNSYGANSRVIGAVQAMWTQLLSAIP